MGNSKLAEDNLFVNIKLSINFTFSRQKGLAELQTPLHRGDDKHYVQFYVVVLIGKHNLTALC